MILTFRSGKLTRVETDGRPAIRIIELERTFDTQAEAEAYALDLAKRWIDGQRA